MLESFKWVLGVVIKLRGGGVLVRLSDEELVAEASKKLPWLEVEFRANKDRSFPRWKKPLWLDDDFSSQFRLASPGSFDFVDVLSTPEKRIKFRRGQLRGNSSAQTAINQNFENNTSTQFLLPRFDPNEWCMKNGLHSGGLNPRPLSHESSALTTRPQLLAYISGSYLHDCNRSLVATIHNLSRKLDRRLVSVELSSVSQKVPKSAKLNRAWMINLFNTTHTLNGQWMVWCRDKRVWRSVLEASDRQEPIYIQVRQSRTRIFRDHW